LRERLDDDEPPLRREPPERDDDEPPRERDDEPLLLEVLREREDEARDDVLRDEEDELFRAGDDELFRAEEAELFRRDVDRRAVRRSAAGISSCATAFVSCGISFARNFAMRSSSRRMPRAIFAVSLSPTWSASVSIDV
jgi:hypothetical protein